jgi:hypothetical protein
MVGISGWRAMIFAWAVHNDMLPMFCSSSADHIGSNLDAPFRKIPTAALEVISSLHWFTRWFPSCQAESDVFNINTGLLSLADLPTCKDACSLPTGGDTKKAPEGNDSWHLNPELGT